jgi:hypothetical protein
MVNALRIGKVVDKCEPLPHAWASSPAKNNGGLQRNDSTNASSGSKQRFTSFNARRKLVL